MKTRQDREREWNTPFGENTPHLGFDFWAFGDFCPPWGLRFHSDSKNY